MTSELHKVNFASPLLSVAGLEDILNKSKVKSLSEAPRQFYIRAEVSSIESRRLLVRLMSPRYGHP